MIRRKQPRPEVVAKMADAERSGQRSKSEAKWKFWVAPAITLSLAAVLVAIFVIVLVSRAGSFSEPSAISLDTGGSGTSTTRATPKGRPHIILILADDLGYNDISWHNSSVDTPILESLARDGVILEQNYMPPMCNPSRGSLMTGKYPFRIKLQHTRLTLSEWCIPHEEKMLPEFLRDVGYKNHVVGKWHQGFCSWNCTPLYRGWDSFYGFYRPYITHYTHLFANGYDWRDGDEVDFSANGTYTTHLITRRSVEIIQNHNPDEPLFLFVSHGDPHVPVEVPPGVPSHDHSTPEGKRADYLAMVKTVDDSTGEILQALRDTGMYDNSVIIFTADNGAARLAGSNYPLRGSKFSVFEGGARAVAFVHSSRQTNKGTVSHGFVHAVDWFETIISLAETSSSTTGGNRDGLDQTDHVLYSGVSPRREIVYNVDNIPPYSIGKAAVRHGDYKLILGYPGLTDGWEQHGNKGQAHIEAILTNGNYTGDLTENPPEVEYDWDAVMEYARMVNDSVLLFNIKEDPTEENNIAEDFPDIVETLRRRLEVLESEIVPQSPKRYTFQPQGVHAKFGGIWTPGWCNFEDV